MNYDKLKDRLKVILKNMLLNLNGDYAVSQIIDTEIKPLVAALQEITDCKRYMIGKGSKNGLPFSIAKVCLKQLGYKED